MQLNPDITNTKLLPDGSMDRLLTDMWSWAGVIWSTISPFLWTILGVLLAMMIFAGVIYLVVLPKMGYK